MNAVIDLKQLEFFAGLKQVQVRRCTEHHIQINGKYQVNLYPTTNRIYIRGMNYSARVFDHVEAVDYATGERFPTGVAAPGRKAMTGKKMALWEKPAYRKCGICKLPIATPAEATVDHKIPLSRGGSNRMDNLQLAHAGCNQKKGNAV